MITVDFKKSIVCSRLRARMVWQELFNIYRDGGGDLSRMDSLLCDLAGLDVFFQNRTNDVLYFYFDRDYTNLLEVSEHQFSWKIQWHREEQTVTIQEVTLW